MDPSFGFPKPGSTSCCSRGKRTFKFSLGTARAPSCGAWIITGGTHTGVMKHVGEAVKDYTLSSSVQSQIVAIGIPTWGIIHNRDTLVQAELQGFPAHYLMGC
ncbi:transient receptor potential cation channel subfamily M member 2-like [Takifugu rubripes]|uniref:transient receptor potential cation channel subfamily M member 2-like n=1 Tax=Takifugu rubripes TaxID=31033 RepID=UPI0011457A8D|nr:transient receptor potential cation channel subfamily M member 2-like [Takifugu rubripes]